MIPDEDDSPGPYSPNDADDDAEFISDINILLKEYADAMDAVKFRLGLQTVMLISGGGNIYLPSSGLTRFSLRPTKNVVLKLFQKLSTSSESTCYPAFIMIYIPSCPRYPVPS